MYLTENLTKENFWNERMQQHPKATNLFCQWIDDYKKAVNWNVLFNHGAMKYIAGPPLDYEKVSAPKFHDLPYGMQQGIWIEFTTHILDKFYEQPEYQYSGDLAEDVNTVFSELEPLIEPEDL